MTTALLPEEDPMSVAPLVFATQERAAVSNLERLRQDYERIAPRLEALGYAVPFKAFERWSMSEYTAVVRWIPQMIAAKGSGRPIEPLPPVCLQRYWVKADQPEAQPTEPTSSDTKFDKLVSWMCATLTTEQLATINALVLAELDNIAPYDDAAPLSPIERALVDFATAVEAQLQHRAQTITERETEAAHEIVITIGMPQEQAFLLPVYRIISKQLAASQGWRPMNSRG